MYSDLYLVTQPMWVLHSDCEIFTIAVSFTQQFALYEELSDSNHLLIIFRQSKLPHLTVQVRAFYLWEICTHMLLSKYCLPLSSHWDQSALCKTSFMGLVLLFCPPVQCRKCPKCSRYSWVNQNTSCGQKEKDYSLHMSDLPYDRALSRMCFQCKGDDEQLEPGLWVCV